MMRPTVKTDKYELWLGDCREILPYIKRPDAIHTDPPYGLAKKLVGGTWGKKFLGGLDWDREASCDFVLPLLGLAPIVSIWGGNYYDLPPSRGWLSWFKPDSPPTMADFELAWTNLDQNAKQISHSIAATNAERVGHPTQKPVRVMAWSMTETKTPKEALVLDPFMGSGSTGVGCMMTGRYFIGIEQDETYFNLAHARIAMAAGKPIELARPANALPSLFDQ